MAYAAVAEFLDVFLWGRSESSIRSFSGILARSVVDDMVVTVWCETSPLYVNFPEMTT